MVSIADVAKRAGVHKSTVSRAMSDPARVSPETQERIKRAAKSLGYRPNAVARMLANGSSPLVAFLVPDIANPFFAEMARGIAAAVEREGQYLTLCDTHGDRLIEQKYLDSLYEMQTRMIVMVPGSDTELEAVAEQARDEAAVVVIVDRVPSACSLSSVSSDGAAGVVLALNHLKTLGHTRILHVSGPMDTLTGRERHAAYVTYMHDNALDAMVSPGGYQIEDGRIAAVELLKSESLPSAVLTANDLSAIGLIGELTRHGLSVPDDISVVGYDDLAIASHFQPALTTVQQPIAEIAAQAVSLAVSEYTRTNLEGDVDARHLKLQPSLAVRATTRAISA